MDWKECLSNAENFITLLNNGEITIQYASNMLKIYLSEIKRYIEHSDSYKETLQKEIEKKNEEISILESENILLEKKLTLCKFKISEESSLLFWQEGNKIVAEMETNGKRSQQHCILWHLYAKNLTIEKETKTMLSVIHDGIIQCYIKISEEDILGTIKAEDK